MGQGLYDGVVFGCLKSDITGLPEGEEGDDLWEAIQKAADVDLVFAYEAEPRYYGFPLLCSEWGPWDDLPSIPTREVVDLAGWVSRLVEELGEETEQEVKGWWLDLQNAAFEQGVIVPDGRLLYVSDYD